MRLWRLTAPLWEGIASMTRSEVRLRNNGYRPPRQGMVNHSLLAEKHHPHEAHRNRPGSRGPPREASASGGGSYAGLFPMGFVRMMLSPPNSELFNHTCRVDDTRIA